MPPNESPSVSVSRCGHRPLGHDPLRTVVWVRGEQDIATRVHLSCIIAQVADLDGADIVVDLSGVTFMDASTIGALVAARARLRASARALSVRDPSPRALRLLDLCGLAVLVDGHQAPTQPSVTTALGSWVDVPARDRGSDTEAPPIADGATSQRPARVMARRHGESAELVQQPRAAS